ncbi:MAG: ThuA domain-containing protein [Armatimonadota bacterium]|nr:ThuA domain-containing protein [Armatimonadota bacterium]
MSTRRFLLAALVLVLSAQAGFSLVAVDKAPRAPAPTKVLMEVGGPYHDNPALYEMLKKKLEATGRFVLTITDNRDELAKPAIDKYDVVLIYTTGGSLTEAQEKGLISFVENGKGVVGIHSATDSFKNSDAYWKLMCGRFAGHGSGTFKVKITGKSHVIVKGMSEFEITDETYRHTWHPESKPIVLMRREEDNEPVSWVQYYGKGRVFVTGLGHGKPAWENPAFQQLIERALDWAAGRLNP